MNATSLGVVYFCGQTEPLSSDQQVTKASSFSRINQNIATRLAGVFNRHFNTRGSYFNRRNINEEKTVECRKKGSKMLKFMKSTERLVPIVEIKGKTFKSVCIENLYLELFDHGPNRLQAEITMCNSVSFDHRH